MEYEIEFERKNGGLARRMVTADCLPRVGERVSAAEFVQARVTFIEHRVGEPPLVRVDTWKPSGGD